MHKLLLSISNVRSKSNENFFFIVSVPKLQYSIDLFLKVDKNAISRRRWDSKTFQIFEFFFAVDTQKLGQK